MRTRGTKNEKRADEVHSETTTRKLQQCEWAADFRGLAMDAGRQPSEKNLDILDILDALQKSSGNFAGFQEGPRGPRGRLGGRSEVGGRKSGGREWTARWQRDWKEGVERVRKYLAFLALLALLQESSGNLSVFKIAQGCQVAALGIADFGLGNADCGSKTCCPLSEASVQLKPLRSLAKFTHGVC
jgi:hypothetical protein